MVTYTSLQAYYFLLLHIKFAQSQQLETMPAFSLIASVDQTWLGPVPKGLTKLRLWGRIRAHSGWWVNEVPRRCRTEVSVFLLAISQGLVFAPRGCPHSYSSFSCCPLQQWQVESLLHSKSLHCSFCNISLTPVWLDHAHLDKPR